MGTLKIFTYGTKGQGLQSTYFAQTQSQAAALIATAFATLQVYRIEFTHV